MGVCASGTEMRPRERFLRALLLEEADMIPMFELEFQKSYEAIGERMVEWDEYKRFIEAGKGDRVLRHNVEVLVKICRALGYDAVRVYNVHDLVEAVRYARRIAPELAVIGSADGTLGIPSSFEEFVKLAKRIRVGRAGIKRELYESAVKSAELARRQVEEGADAIVGCTDYCTNSGPFLNPMDFRDLVTPYLKLVVTATHRAGGFYIKHTDGNLWPVLDDIVDISIDALHSIDPTAGTELREVKEAYGMRYASAAMSI
ncbi:MAG TPA: hypothetical protein ENG30_03930 [Thermofilaceae archaeon]|nr:hypothetical protein [Thermofilaceae archaeon]